MLVNSGEAPQLVSVKLGDGDEELVFVDAQEGPLVNNANGTTSLLRMNENHDHFNSRGCLDVRPYRKPWTALSPTEQAHLLSIAARKNRKLAEWKEAEGGSLLHKCQLPDYLLQGTAPWHTAETQQNFWAEIGSWTTAEKSNKPILCAWYSGGMTKKQGTDLIKDFLDIARARGVTDQVILHHPEGYDIDGDGSDEWPTFLERLEAEIDAEPSRQGRPLILWGHSKGSMAAFSLASKLGDRVLKVYVVASGGPIPGEVSSYQKMADSMKESSDLDLLKWFASMNSDRALHRMIEAVEKGELTVDSSPFLTGKLALMKRQYVHTVYPDMDRDVKVLSCPIMAMWPATDATCPKEAMEVWRHWTNGGFEVKKVAAGHMDCLRVSEHNDVVALDMAAIIKQYEQQH